MPLIDTPFKRVAVDIVGLIVPPNEAGHQYMLTIGDYANRYLEAVPLKKINTDFSPFQLLYGCLVRGPGTIIKELWTTEVNIPQVKTSTSQSYVNVWRIH